jgi:hypothetical protein
LKGENKKRTRALCEIVVDIDREKKLNGAKSESERRGGPSTGVAKMKEALMADFSDSVVV